MSPVIRPLISFANQKSPHPSATLNLKRFHRPTAWAVTPLLYCFHGHPAALSALPNCCFITSQPYIQLTPIRLLTFKSNTISRKSFVASMPMFCACCLLLEFSVLYLLLSKLCTLWWHGPIPSGIPRTQHGTC